MNSVSYRVFEFQALWFVPCTASLLFVRSGSALRVRIGMDEGYLFSLKGVVSVQMSLWVAPLYFREFHVLRDCPLFAKFVDDNDIELEYHKWNGSLASLPAEDHPCFVFAPFCNVPRMEMQSQIEALGHFWFEPECAPLCGKTGFIRDSIEKRLEAFMLKVRQPAAVCS